MSRSYRKTPIVGMTKKESEKKDKRLAHRARRNAERSYGRPVNLREVSNVWAMAKDGKQYFPGDDRRK